MATVKNYTLVRMAKSNLFKNIKIKLRDLFSVYIYRPIFQSFAEKRYSHLHDDVTYIQLKDITGWYSENKLLEVTFEGNIKSGDWSRKITKRESVLNTSSKYRAMVQRYSDGMPWYETDLFKERYGNHLSTGAVVKGFDNIEKVEKHYVEYYDSLFNSLKRDGVKPPDPARNIAPLFIYIDKDGEILYTRDGNHRLYMALVLGIEEIPVKVWTRHKEWQKKKEEIINKKGMVGGQLKKYLNHPDIQPYI